ncbi:MAG: M16 family metallopeptidase [bacterium]
MFESTRNTARINLVLCLAFCASLLFASACFSMDVIEKELQNGLKVYLIPDNSAPIFRIAVYVAAGNIYEQEYLGSGISHFVEHVVAVGSTTKRSRAESTGLLESIGNIYNAYTSGDHTCYSITTTEGDWEVGVDLTSDWVFNCIFDSTEVESERGVILREIEMMMDDPYDRVYEIYYLNSYKSHPKRFPIIGLKQAFQSLSRDDLINYYRKMYVPSNMFVVATGSPDKEMVLKKIEEVFGKYPYKARPQVFLPPEPIQRGIRYTEYDMDSDLAYVLMGWKTGAFVDDDTYPLLVLSSILGSGRTSILYQELIERRDIVQAVSCDFNAEAYGPSDFTITAACDMEKIEEAVESIKSLVFGMPEKRITSQEIEKAKKQLIKRHLFEMASVEGRADALANYILLTGNPDYVDLHIEKIRDVKPEDIRRVAQEYLKEEALTIAVVKPRQAAVSEAAETSEHIGETEIRRVVLPNGITLLIGENHSAPLVYLKASFLCGSYLESPDDNGAFSVLAEMLRRGTRKRKADIIDLDVQNILGYLSTNTTEDMVWCTLELPSENFEKGLELLCDLILNSQFSEDQFEKARENALYYVHARSDDWHADAINHLRKIVYKDHPYALSPYGEEEKILSLDRDYVYSLYKSYLVPENAVFAVFGDINADLVEREFGRAFARFKGGAGAKKGVERWEGIKSQIDSVEYINGEQAIVALAYPAPQFGSQDWCSLKVLDAVLSGAGYSGGRMFNDLRERKLVYYAEASTFDGFYGGVFYIVAATSPETADSTLILIKEHLDRIKQGDFDQEELENAKKMFKVEQTVLESQYVGYQASMACVYEAAGLGYDFGQKIPGMLDQVTRDDVVRVANQYLNDYVALILKPSK